MSVMVKIDAAGNVVYAKACYENPLIRAAAEKAARKAKFIATNLDQVLVLGIIIYNLRPPEKKAEP